ncbi:discoidin domain-containing protein [Chitinophaga sedimenti]|nr:discoidin domain-containing protein [Chitinophaga sedimenti]
MSVKLSSQLDGGKLIYTLDSSAPTASSPEYTGPVAITKSGTFRGVVLQDGKAFGDEFEQTFTFNKATGKTVTLKTPPHEKYNPGSPFSLVNGIRGVEKFNDNQWTAFQGDFEATVDLGDSIAINKLGLSILKYNDQWIYEPKEIVFAVSNDGKTWKEVAKTNTFTAKGINKVRLNVSNVSARYVKVVAKHFGRIPKGAQGEGNPAWLFVDEIVVE